MRTHVILCGSVTMTVETSTNTCAQPDTKCNPNPNPNPNPTTKQQAIVSIQLNIATCPTYPEKFIRDNVIARWLYYAPFVYQVRL